MSSWTSRQPPANAHACVLLGVAREMKNVAQKNEHGSKKQTCKKNIPARDPKQCVRSISRKSIDLDALGSREVMVVMKVGIVVTVAMVVSEWVRVRVRMRVSGRE